MMVRRGGLAVRLTARLALAACAALSLPSSVLAQGAEAEPLPEPGTALAPGRYLSDAVGPSVEFRVEDGWVVGPGTPGPIFTLERADQPGTFLTVTRFDGQAFVDSCDPTSLTEVEASVPRLLEIIGGNPYLNPGPPVATEVDGFSGLQLDVAVPAFTECGLDVLLIWALPIGDGGEFVQVADQQSRFVVLDIDGDVLVIAIESFPGVPFGGLLEASMDLVGSMRLEPGEFVPPPATDDPAANASSAPDATPDPSPSAAAPSGADSEA